MEPEHQLGGSALPAPDGADRPTVPPMARLAQFVWGPLAWVFGYRDVPWRNRLSFRVDFQSQLLWAAMMAMAQTRITQTIAATLMHNSGEMVQAVLFSAAAAGNIASFFWAWLASNRSSIRFIVLPSTLAGLCAMTVALVPANHPYLFSGLVVGMYLAMSGVATVRTAVWHLSYHRAGVGNIVSRFQVSGMVVSAGLGALAGWLLTDDGAFPRSLVPLGPEASYRVMFLVLGACGILGGLLCQRARGGEPEEAAARPRARASLLAGWRILRHDQAYRRFLGFMMIFGFGTMMSDTIMVLLMGDRFRANSSAFEIVLYLVLVPTVVQLVTLPFAGRMLDRTNPMRLRAWGAVAWAISRALLFVAAMTGSLPLLLASQLLSGFGGGLGNVAWQLGHMHFARRDLVQHYMGLHVSATGLRGLIAPFLAVALWSGRELPGWLPAAGGWHIPAIGPAVFAIAMVMQVIGGAGFFWMDRRYKTLNPLGPEVVI